MTVTPDIVQAQFATVATSAARLERVKAHFLSLDAHAAQLRAQLDEAAGDETAGPLRGELDGVQRGRRQVAAVVAGVEAEHARHEADLRASYGDAGQARAVLGRWQADRDAAKASLAQASDVLSRARAHAEAVEARLASAQDDEARRDGEAATALHAALCDGVDLPSTSAPLARASAGLEDDARAARAAEARAAATHRMKASALDEAERRVAGAADAVLSASADGWAREVAALDARASLLRARLSAYADRPRGDYVPPMPPPSPSGAARDPWSPVPTTPGFATPPRVTLTPAVIEALGLNKRTDIVVRPWNTSTDAGDLSAFAAALLTNAEAEPAFASDLRSTPNPITQSAA